MVSTTTLNERSLTMARKAITFPASRADATLVPVLKEVRDYDNGGQLTGYRIMSEDSKVQLGTVARVLGQTRTLPNGKVQEIIVWTATAGGKGTGFPKRTVTQPTRAKAIMAAIPGSYNAS